MHRNEMIEQITTMQMIFENSQAKVEVLQQSNEEQANQIRTALLYTNDLTDQLRIVQNQSDGDYLEELHQLQRIVNLASSANCMKQDVEELQLNWMQRP